MTVRSLPPHSVRVLTLRRLRQLAAAGLPLLWVVAYLLGSAAPSLHIALVEHVPCPVGGELIHADDLNQVAACTDEESLPTDEGDSDEHGEHGSCDFQLGRSERPTPPFAWRATVRPASPVLAVRAQQPRRTARIAVFLRAPKNSPPRA